MNTADQHTHTFADEPGDPSQPTAERAPETAPSEPMPVTNDFDAGSDQPPPIPQDPLAAESAWSLDAQPSATEPAIAPADGGDAGREGDASALKAGGRGPRRSRGGKDRDRGPGTSQALGDRPARRSPIPKASNQQRELIVNYVPGEECRVAVIVDGKLDEFYSERNDAVSHVGNIYVGRVTNVEPSIQAAFVDFGLQHAGFLHTSDVHPRYFPGERGDTTERIGKKTPRRDRPPIQECFRRGDEVIVQVLKEGVGSKGPTVTSYLSIPGRYLVMMPGMDRVGVSRKVEDEDLRDKMKAILDQLELPEGFGFIVRTAGLDKTKTELKRDLSYLMRLQKDMERRKKAGNKPRLLYSESDLLVRTLRDMSSTETDKIMIDSELGLQRAARFLKIVSPRSATKLFHYTGKTPIFHATGIESQIKNIYTREVPLPSGGRLVIDETEALVAIDVNSGRARDASDSETNALRTNLEAIDEIARQLRLLRNQGMERRYENEVIGFNTRMTDIHAAIGRVQLGKLNEWTAKRQSNAAFLNANITGVITPPTAPGAVHVFHQYTVRIAGAERDAFAAELTRRGVGNGVYYPTPIHRLPSFALDIDLPNTEIAAAEVLSLPVHPSLTEAELETVASIVSDVAKAGS